MPMQIRGTVTPNDPPTGLVERQLSVEMGSTPPKLWCGVPTSIDPSGRLQLLPQDMSAYVTSAALTTALAGYLPLTSLPLSIANGGSAAAAFPMTAATGQSRLLMTANGTTALSVDDRVGLDSRSQLRVMEFGAAFNAIPYLNVIRARGTPAAPAAAQSGDVLGAVYYDGWPTGVDSCAMIGAIATENQTATTRGASLDIHVCQNGSPGATSLGPALTVDEDQTVAVPSVVVPLEALRLCDGSNTGFNIGGNAATWFAISYAPSNNSQGLWLSSTGDLEISGDATKPTAGGWTASSDIRMKEAIEPYRKGLAELLQLEPIEFAYRGRAGRYVGLDAAKVRPLMPEMIKVGGSGMLMMDPHALTFALINAVKTLAADLRALEQRTA